MCKHIYFQDQRPQGDDGLPRFPVPIRSSLFYTLFACPAIPEGLYGKVWHEEVYSSMFNFGLPPAHWTQSLVSLTCNLVFLWAMLWVILGYNRPYSVMGPGVICSAMALLRVRFYNFTFHDVRRRPSYQAKSISMMTSSKGNFSHVIGPLFWEFTGHHAGIKINWC